MRFTIYNQKILRFAQDDRHDDVILSEAKDLFF